MKKQIWFFVVTLALCWLAAAPNLRGTMSGVAYTDFANVFTANQRVNAGLGVNVAPGSTGTIKASGGLFDLSRSTALGEWTNVAYASGNFTASGSMTWTVESGDQVAYSYMLIGHTMWLAFALNNTTVGGTPSTELHVAIPGGFTGKNNATLGAVRSFDNGTDTVGFCGAVASAAYVRCWRGGFSNWAASTNSTSLQAFVTLEVQ